MRCTVTSPSIKYFQYFGFLGLVIGTSAFAYYTLLSNKLWLMHNGMHTLLEPQCIRKNNYRGKHLPVFILLDCPCERAHPWQPVILIGYDGCAHSHPSSGTMKDFGRAVASPGKYFCPHPTTPRRNMKQPFVCSLQRPRLLSGTRRHSCCHRCRWQGCIAILPRTIGWFMFL